MDITSLPNSCHDKLPIAVIKSVVEDFQVDEELGFDPCGEGEHLWVLLRKRGWNTRDVIERVAAEFKIAARDVGYSGLKDRHAITTQWLSIPLAKVADRDNVEQQLTQALSIEENLSLLRVCCGQKKLRPGSHRFNRFTIVLRELCDATDETNERLQRLSTQGFPNYFGAQRFGDQGGNLARAASMLRRQTRVSRFKRGIYLSAVRAYLFNLVLAKRIEQGNWNHIVDGELCILDGSNSVFVHDNTDDSIQKRCAQFDIHPSGPLCGRGTSLSIAQAADIEADALSEHVELMQGLEKAGVTLARRALRALPNQLQWQWLDHKTLQLSFRLRRGVYATSLLAELAQISQAG